MPVLSLSGIKAFASRRHSFEKYGGQSYAFHLNYVESVLSESGYSSYIWSAAAWLHDTIEDTGTTRKEIEDLAGIEVGNLVWAVTGIGANRKERNQDQYRKILAYPTASILKIADRITNVELSVKLDLEKYGSLYLSEASEFDRIMIRSDVPDLMLQRLYQAYRSARMKW